MGVSVMVLVLSFTKVVKILKGAEGNYGREQREDGV